MSFWITKTILFITRLRTAGLPNLRLTLYSYREDETQGTWDSWKRAFTFVPSHPGKRELWEHFSLEPSRSWVFLSEGKSLGKRRKLMAKRACVGHGGHSALWSSHAQLFLSLLKESCGQGTAHNYETGQSHDQAQIPGRTTPLGIVKRRETGLILSIFTARLTHLCLFHSMSLWARQETLFAETLWAPRTGWACTLGPSAWEPCSCRHNHLYMKNIWRKCICIGHARTFILGILPWTIQYAI